MRPACHEKEVGLWYFCFVVKEANSEVMKSTYDLEVEVIEDYSSCIEVNFVIDSLIQLSELKPLVGQVWFTSAIDMSWIAQEDNFYKVFKIEWYEIDDLIEQEGWVGKYADPEGQLKVHEVRD